MPTASPTPGPSSRVRLSSAGTALLSVAAVFLLLGLFKNINLLLLLGYFLLGVVVVNVLLAKAGGKGLRASARPPDTPFAEQRASALVRLENPDRGRWGIAVVLRVGPHALSWFVPRLPGRQTLTLRQEVILPRRGVHLWGPVEVTHGYPFGLARRHTTLADAREVLVLPRIGGLHRGRFRRFLHGKPPPGERSARRPRALASRAPGEFHNLRGYRPGDSSRSIHWRTTARRADLTVVEYSPVELAENLLVVFDPEGPDAPPEAFEQAVRLAATLCREWCRHRGDRLTLALADPEPRLLEGTTGPGHGRRLLEALALQQPTAPADPDARAARIAEGVAAGRDPWLSVVVIGVRPGRLADALRGRLRRPAAPLALPGEWDFYDPPSD